MGETMLSYLLQNSLLCYDLITVKPSLITASALFLSRVTLGCNLNGGYWNETLKYYTTYTIPDLKPTVLILHKMHKNAPEAGLSGVFEKFQEEKYYKIALKAVALDKELEMALAFS